MTETVVSEATVASSLRQQIDEIAGRYSSIEDAETAALGGGIAAPLHSNPEWTAFRSSVTSAILHRGYIVIRGLNVDEGRSMLIVSTLMGSVFDSYSPGMVVKRYRMSPWTKELSNTTSEGDFHTDANVSETPPIGTAIQCEQADPGAPEYAEQRVAYLPHLLARLASVPRYSAGLAFLTQSESALAHERSQRMWRGRLVHQGIIRYHPHSLRIASSRLGEGTQVVESAIEAIHNASVDVSAPFHTQPGDTLLVSNRTALHYRGACSVRFTDFPLKFDSRSVLVLHVRDKIIGESNFHEPAVH